MRKNIDDILKLTPNLVCLKFPVPVLSTNNPNIGASSVSLQSLVLYDFDTGSLDVPRNYNAGLLESFLVMATNRAKFPGLQSVAVQIKYIRISLSATLFDIFIETIHFSTSSPGLKGFESWASPYWTLTMRRWFLQIRSGGTGGLNPMATTTISTILRMFTSSDTDTSDSNASTSAIGSTEAPEIFESSVQGQGWYSDAESYVSEERDDAEIDETLPASGNVNPGGERRHGRLVNQSVLC